MGNTNLLTNTFIDSIQNQIPTIKVIAQLPEDSSLDNVNTIANIIIAIVNIVLIVYIFAKSYKKDELNSEKSRKIDLLKTLVLEWNMSKFYEFYNNLIIETQALQTKNLTNEHKIAINNTIKDLAISFRQNFTDPFIAIDKHLYNNILEKTDTLIDGLTNNIFDEGNNLSHKPRFDEVITKVICESKTEIIKILFSYSGE